MIVNRLYGLAALLLFVTPSLASDWGDARNVREKYLGKLGITRRVPVKNVHLFRSFSLEKPSENSCEYNENESKFVLLMQKINSAAKDNISLDLYDYCRVVVQDVIAHNCQSVLKLLVENTHECVLLEMVFGDPLIKKAFKKSPEASRYVKNLLTL